MKKTICFLLSLLMVVSLCACGGNPSDATTNPAVTTQAPPANPGTSTEAAGQAIEAIFEGPTLICSAGQSADYQMVQVMFQQSNMENVCKDIAKPEDFSGIKTIVVAIGGSSKGLGAAGIDADEELVRVKALLEAAKAQNIPIISCHIGGSGRRGKLPISIAMVVAAIAGSLVSGNGLSFRHLIEGTFSYIGTIITIATAKTVWTW